MLKADDNEISQTLDSELTQLIPRIIVYRTMTDLNWKGWQQTDPIVESYMQRGLGPPVLAIDSSKVILWAPYFGLSSVPALAMLGPRNSEGRREVIARLQKVFTAQELDEFAGLIQPKKEKSKSNFGVVALLGAGVYLLFKKR